MKYYNKTKPLPTLQEVRTQFELKGIPGIEHEKFYAYYESVGWFVGKKKMVNWRGAVAGWILRIDQFTNNQTKHNDRFSEESIRTRMDNW